MEDFYDISKYNATAVEMQQQPKQAPLPVPVIKDGATVSAFGRMWKYIKATDTLIPAVATSKPISPAMPHPSK